VPVLTALALLLCDCLAGFAYKQFAGRSKEEYRTNPDAVPKDGLVFAGLISLVDPPKPGVPEAIAECRDAFIRVTMVTGESGAEVAQRSS